MSSAPQYQPRRPTALQIAQSHVGDVGGDAWWSRTRPAFRGAPWAGAFVVSCLTQSGSTVLEDAPNPYYPQGLLGWTSEQGLTIPARDARPGDLVFAGACGHTHWVTILEDVAGGAFHVIGGNWVDEDHPVGVVARRSIEPERVTGVVRPEVTAVASPSKR